MDAHGWLLDATDFRIVIALWLAAVLAFGLWRSRGDAPQDPLRPSGPHP